MLLPEIVAVGLYSSQFIAKSASVSQNRKTTMFEIEIPLENGGVSFIDETAMPITPNIVICAKPGQSRHTKFPYKCYFLHIILDSGILYDTLMDAPNIFETDRAESYRAIFAKLIKHNEAPDSEIILHSLVLELIHTIRRDTGAAAQSKWDRGNVLRMKPVIRYIKDNLTEDLCLQKVAEYAALSPIHFHNCFQSATGQTLREYVEDQRIKKAILLLTTTNHSLTEIAYECGFSSQSYFSYVFKRKFGKTPREYIRDVYSKYNI